MFFIFLSRFEKQIIYFVGVFWCGPILFSLVYRQFRAKTKCYVYSLFYLIWWGRNSRIKALFYCDFVQVHCEQCLLTHWRSMLNAGYKCLHMRFVGLHRNVDKQRVMFEAREKNVRKYLASAFSVRQALGFYRRALLVFLWRGCEPPKSGSNEIWIAHIVLCAWNKLL